MSRFKLTLLQRMTVRFFQEKFYTAFPEMVFFRGKKCFFLLKQGKIALTCPGSEHHQDDISRGEDTQLRVSWGMPFDVCQSCMKSGWPAFAASQKADATVSSPGMGQAIPLPLFWDVEV